MSDKYPMTKVGAEKLRAELHELKSVARPKVVADIAEARAHGDLKENAEYHAARDQQGFIEARVKEVEGKLSNALIIDIEIARANANGRVIFGATVVVADADSGDEITYQIVGEDEADIKQGRISVGSPIARGLIGKSADDVIEITVPGGTRELEIVEVSYEP